MASRPVINLAPLSYVKYEYAHSTSTLTRFRKPAKYMM